MIRAFDTATGRFITQAWTLADVLPDSLVWLDVDHPTADEERALEGMLGIAVPTPEEMRELEPSSRLYQESGAVYMSASLVSQADTDEPETTAVTFIYTGKRLITIRYSSPRAFTAYAAHSERQPVLCGSALMTLVGLLEAIVDRSANILEKSGEDIDQISKRIFNRSRGTAKARRKAALRLENALSGIALEQDKLSRLRESLVSLGRLASYFLATQDGDLDHEHKEHVKSVIHDIHSLTDHTSYTSSKISFILDATLGLINIEQNAIIKIFSVVSVIFLPPTLVASVYGMNFRFMPELNWQYGYPFAIAIMLGSAILPFVYFKKRGWL